MVPSTPSVAALTIVLRVYTHSERAFGVAQPKAHSLCVGIIPVAILFANEF